MSGPALAQVRIGFTAARKLRRGHPWVWVNELVGLEGHPEAGDLVEVREQERLLGYGYYNPRSSIAVRLLYPPEAGPRGGGIPNERQELERKLDRARTRRQGLKLDSDAFRLIWSEADGLPGVVADQYGDLVVVQFLTAGADQRRAIVLDWLVSRLKPRGVFERSEGTHRQREGLHDRVGWIWPVPPPESLVPEIEVHEGPLRYGVRLDAGHKTGFYLDQRAARRTLRGLSLQGRVLDAFAYTGGFTCAALAAGAREVVAVERSAEALEQLLTNVRRNGFSDRVTAVRANVFHYLNEAAERGEKFDAIILDPPPFARRKEHVPRALQGYHELHRRVGQLLAPNGWLLTCSCSQAIGRTEFKNSVLAGLRDQRRVLKVESLFGPDADHPEIPQVPESRYLACLLARVR